MAYTKHEWFNGGLIKKDTFSSIESALSSHDEKITNIEEKISISVDPNYAKKVNIFAHEDCSEEYGYGITFEVINKNGSVTIVESGTTNETYGGPTPSFVLIKNKPIGETCLTIGQQYSFDSAIFSGLSMTITFVGAKKSTTITGDSRTFTVPENTTAITCTIYGPSIKKGSDTVYNTIKNLYLEGTKTNFSISELFNYILEDIDDLKNSFIVEN